MVEKHPVQQILLGALLLWALAAQLTYSGLAVYLEANTDRYAELPFAREPFSSAIASVPESYRASGLQPGDEILALNGQPFEGETEIRYQLRPGDVLNVSVNRHGRQLSVPITLHSPPRQWTIVSVLFVLLPLSCL